jgi:hypothetical protein
MGSELFHVPYFKVTFTKIFYFLFFFIHKNDYIQFSYAIKENLIFQLLQIY